MTSKLVAPLDPAAPYTLTTYLKSANRRGLPARDTSLRYVHHTTASCRNVSARPRLHNHANPKASYGSALCLDLWDHLHCIIANRRAETLGDVAAQLGTAFIVLGWFGDISTTPQADADRYIRMLRQIVLGALPVVAAAAGVDLEELDAAALVGFADREFPPVTAPLHHPPGGNVGFGEAQS